MEMMRILTSIGSYEVSRTKWKEEIRELLSETNAGWLILDLNLEDGNSADLVPVLRKQYGSELFILILSGYFEDYPEYDLLAGGADLYLRKPYRPMALLQQMGTLRGRMEGKELKREACRKLKIGDGILDPEQGIFRKGKTEVRIPKAHAKLIEVLASARDEDGWQYVERRELITHLWGEAFEKNPQAASDRLRTLRYRVKDRLGVDVIDIRLSSNYGSPSYRLSSDVELVEEK
jgi:DNA-binding response OmpR family regulator